MAMEIPADRLSALPDDVLLLVLGKLGSTREAIGTCVLSRRWRRLPCQLPEPKISICDFLPKGTELSDLRAAELSRATDAFCRAVASFLSAAESTRCLKLEFCLADACTSAVQRLLLGDDGRRAKVGALQLAIRTTVHVLGCTGALRRRYARRLDRFMAASPGVFRLVTRLELWNLWIGGEGVAAVLGACRRLEHLELCHCYGSGEEALEIDAPPGCALRELVLHMCYYRLVVVRSAPKLTRLTCRLWLAVRSPLSLRAGAVPCLETLVLSNPAAAESKPFALSKLLANTTSLRSLSLNFEGEEIWIEPEPPRLLCAAIGKLTALSVGGITVQCDLLWMLFLLEAAPFLREFSVAVLKHVCSDEGYNEQQQYGLVWKQSDFRHNHLETLRVSGFEAEDKYFTFVRLIMERAKNLKTVILSDEESCGYCGFPDDPTSAQTGSSYPKNDDEKCSIVKQLKDELTSSVQIFIR